MATKTEVQQTLINKINGLIADGDAKALVYLAKALETGEDGTTVQELLVAQGDMIIRGATGLEVIKIADMLAPYQNVLESGVSIKTIGGASILGGGNIEISNTILNFEKPDIESVLFTKTSPSALTIPVGFSCRVGDVSIEVIDNAYALNLTDNLVGSSKTAGTDYYIYAKADGTFYISASKTITADRLIGGFHYGLVPEAEAVTGNKTEADMVNIRGINVYSFWDLKFKSIAGNDGMVLVGSKWYDIYLLNSEHIDNGTSKAGATIAAGSTSYGRARPKIPLTYGGNNSLDYGKLTWFQLCEIATSHGKELIDYSKFPTIAYGVYEGKSSSTDGYETIAGKIEHYPELTSKYGIEQASGVQWTWGANVAGNRNEGSTSWAWRDKVDQRGSIYALHNNHVSAVLLGGNRGDGVNAGSRASNWHYCVWSSGWDIGCRFACDHLKLV